MDHNLFTRSTSKPLTVWPVEGILFVVYVHLKVTWARWANEVDVSHFFWDKYQERFWTVLLDECSIQSYYFLLIHGQFNRQTQEDTNLHILVPATSHKKKPHPNHKLSAIYGHFHYSLRDLAMI